MERTSRLIDEKAAAALVQDGMTVYIGGFTLSSHPMAIVREILKRRVKNLTVVGAATASMEVDLMIAAGAVRKVITSYVGIEGHASVGPCFRADAESGDLEVWELDESMYYTALRAGSLEVPFLPDYTALGTDILRFNPDLKRFDCPITGKPLIAVPAVSPDIAFIHGAAADVYGNVRFTGSGFGDRTGARASTKIVAQVDKIISNEDIRMAPQLTSMPNVAHVVRTPFGAHPFAAPGSYVQDNPLIGEYVQAAQHYQKTRERARLDAFLQRWVYEPDSHLDYLERVGLKRLLSLNEF